MAFVFTYSMKENTNKLKKCFELKIIEGEIIHPNLTHIMSQIA